MNRLFLRALLLALAIYFLLFFHLSGVGLLSTDEPRYASIGREMDHSGDWVTPRLWGEPWFEKPALLYWMVGLGFRVGLGDDLAPRLPVALMSLAFLVLFQRLVEDEFGREASWYATLMLSTTAGWIAYSHVAVTDLPLTAAFSAFMLLTLRWFTTGKRAFLLAAGACLGLAVLAKGLVPLVLAAPVVLLGRRRWGDLLLIPPAAALTGAPWYLACTLRNGEVFLQDFFWKHHFERFSSEAIQHVQQFWFYIPVLLGGLIPWTPVLALVPSRRLWTDPRERFLSAWFAFGFIFFSASTNKLPGYLLPLVPALAVLMGIRLAAAKRGRWAIVASAVLLALIPLAAEVLPRAIREGILRAGPPQISWIAFLPFAALAFLVWWWDRRGGRTYAIASTFGTTVACVVYLKVALFPVLDHSVSTRELWRQIEPRRAEVCVEPIHRAWRYGLNYYSVEPLPPCEAAPRPLHVRQQPREPAYLAD